MQGRSGRTYQDLGKATFDALKGIGNTLDTMIDEGALTSAEQLLDKLASTLRLPTDVLNPLKEKAKQGYQRRQLLLDKDLRTAAEAAKCEVLCQPPFVWVGCVTLHEEKPGEWSLCVLDKTVLETVRTSSGALLVQRAVARIEEIEVALREYDVFLQSLQTIRGIMGHASSLNLPVNVLMVLCSHGRLLKKHLTGVDGAGLGQDMSRAQFGYLLAHSRQGEAAPSSIRIRLLPATQYDTSSSHRFIPVPENTDPRKLTERTPIASIELDQ